MSHSKTPFALFGLLAAALLLVLAPAASAKSGDRNHDRLPDRWERAHHLSLKVNQAGRDQDHDGMKNRAEFKAGTDPRDNDTDDDGVKDGAEDSGTVVSFTNGTLTIKLYRNDKTVEGKVDDQTEIKCEDKAASARSHDAGGDDRGDDGDRGDHSGPGDGQAGGDDQGDDNDDQGEHEQGDDHGNASCGTAQLTPGAVVHEAELRTTPDGLVFDEIKLAAAAPTA